MILHEETSERRTIFTVLYAYLLQESGFKLLQENGSALLIEGSGYAELMTEPLQTPFIYEEFDSSVVTQ